uniref:Uncharacterized protein n=1 Tax=Chelydra serpentina TaxID=8475 RepID=A0A8C3SPR0_CHESE
MKMMYIYKRPYVHFPMIFLRQNCDMCIIKILFNPLPMEIFWKKAYFQFLKDEKSACILLKQVFCVKH